MSNKYDVIIIGAGIGGLVCGCYLAKAGLKVLIIEKNANPGGYCNSFEVKGYKFDGCVHSLGNLSPDGRFYQILNELGVYEKLKLERYDPSDVIISQDYRISFWSDRNKLVEDLGKVFPSQKKAIQDFFLKTIQTGEFEAVAKFRNKNFKEVLDEHFNDDKLKSMLALPVFGNMGVPAKYMNAFTAIKHYLQFLTDGGYYPSQGIQSLPNCLTEKFTELGGAIIFSDKVENINLKKSENEIVTHKNEKFITKVIVSNCDAHQTFMKLIGENNLSDHFQKKLRNMVPSLTIFTLYLGVEESFINKFEKSNYWYMNDYNYDEEFEFSLNGDFDFNPIHWILVCPDKKNMTMLAFFLAPFKNEEFWIVNRSKYMQIAIDALCEHISDLKENIKFKSCSTPYNLHQWTNSYKGAAYGWASIKGQFVDPDFTTNAINEDLYLCSQWSTFSSGVNTVAIVGEKVSQKVRRRFKTSVNNY